ncbi:MAG: adenylate/guanylate cyclase domain-containing protein [Myxococcota bacterium]
MNESSQEIGHNALDRVPWWRSFVFRFVGGYTGLVLVLLLVLSIHDHQQQQHEVITRFGTALEAIAQTTALFIDGDDLKAIMTNADIQTEQFIRVRGLLERVAAENGLNEDQIYILRQTGPHNYAFVVMLQNKTFVGDPYQPPPSLTALYNWSLSQHDAVRTELYTDAHGTFISGLAPIVDSRGEVVAILQVDHGLDAYLAEIDRYFRLMLASEGVIFVLVLMFGVWMHLYMHRKVEELLRATQAIQSENYDYSIPTLGSDELGTVAAALNRVLVHLKERFEMLKFLPRHTARMIEAASRSGGVRLDEARLVRAVVLESDIRGFSSISESMSPEEVIAMLNLYIRVQADLVEAARGSIDKYMGDAVLAVFEGEGMEERAIECAIAIQRAVAQMNREGVFAQPIHIGVGLSVGELVMGNMGSERRMEYTIIGATVNLAARLCSAATGGQIVAQAELLDTLAHLSFPKGDSEMIRVKGFEEAVACYRLQVAQPGS